MKFLHVFIVWCITLVWVDAVNVMSSVSITEKELYNKNVINRHLAGIRIKRTLKQTIPNNAELFTLIMAEIKARIHTDITSKISASVIKKKMELE